MSTNATADFIYDIYATTVNIFSEPIDPKHAVTKNYVDNLFGANTKESVRVATTANIPTLNSVTLNGTTIDGVLLTVGDRVLVKDQTSPVLNGIYVVNVGPATRSPDANEDVEVTSGMHFFVEEGTLSGDIAFVLATNNPITLGVTSLVFNQYSSVESLVAGDGITKTGLVLATDPSSAGTGLSYASGVLSVNTSQPQVTSVGTLTSLTVNGDFDNNDDGSVVWSSDFTGGPISSVVRVRRLGPLVIVEFEQVSGTSNTTTFAPDTFLVPVENRPHDDTIYFPALVRDNSVNQMGLISIDTAGFIKIYPTSDPTTASNWTASGTKTLRKTCIQYLVT